MGLFNRDTVKNGNASAKPGNLLEMGNALRKERKFSEAFDCYSRALAEDPRNGNIWRAVAETQAMNFKYPESVESCDQAIKINPADTEAWYLKGFAMQMQEKYKEAIACTQKIIEINPNHILAWCNQGEYYYAMGKLEDALESFSKAIQIDPESRYAREVDAKIRKWLQRDGKDDAWINDIITFLQSGNHQQSLEGYQEALDVDPRSVDRNFNKDYALKHLENPEQMRAEYLKAKRDSQPRIEITLSEKEFEFGRDTWVDLTINNTGSAAALKLTYAFPPIFKVKHKEVDPELLQKQAVDPSVDLTLIPSLAPGAKLTRTVSLTPSKLGDMTLDITVSCTDAWGTKHQITLPVWVSIFRAGKQVPTIPGFDVSWRLSTGETADIYAAKTKDGIATVIKTLRVDAKQATTMKELITEIKLWNRLQHPNIVRCLQYGEQPKLWISLEYMAKGTLTKRIGQLSVIQSLQIASQLVDAVAYAKRLSAIHRFICTDNVLFDENQVPKITNWRITNITRKMIINKMVFPYQAPEQVCTDFGGAGHHTDIYQLGVILFEMLTGEPPFTKKDDELVEQIKTVTPARPSSFNRTILPALDDIVLKCMAKDKKERYQDAAQLKTEIDNVSRTYLH
jgi:tetratricopeptide (TPR) repeat protein